MTSIIDVIVDNNAAVEESLIIFLHGSHIQIMQTEVNVLSSDHTETLGEYENIKVCNHHMPIVLFIASFQM